MPKSTAEMLSLAYRPFTRNYNIFVQHSGLHASCTDIQTMANDRCRVQGKNSTNFPISYDDRPKNVVPPQFAIRSTEVYIHCQYPGGTLWMSAGLPVILSDIFRDLLSSVFPTHYDEVFSSHSYTEHPEWRYELRSLIPSAEKLRQYLNNTGNVRTT